MQIYNTKEFLKKVHIYFPNIKLLSEYKGISNKVLIEDDYGNKFLVFPQSLTRGHPPGIITAVNKNEYFKFLADNVHDSKYNYSKVEYTSAHDKITIICPIHGEFSQFAYAHLNLGQGCNNCGIESTRLKRVDSVEDFIIKSNLVHNNKYSYNNSVYINQNEKLIITCPEHGDFYQRPFAHISHKQGCPKCYTPTGRNLKQWIESCNDRNVSVCVLYFIRCFNDYENFIKIGITGGTIEYRFKGTSIPYSFEVIREIKGSPDFIWNEEKDLHELFKHQKYTPKIKFSGSTECFKISILSDCMSI